VTDQEEAAARAEVDRMIEDGLAALEDEQYELAAEIFRRVIQRAPFRHDARDYLAFALDQQFARESGRIPSRRVNGAVGMSSAAAATSSRARPARIHFPVKLAATVLAVALFVIAVVTVANQLNLRDLVGGSGGKPSASPVMEKIAEKMKRADGALIKGRFDEALQILDDALKDAEQLDPPDTKPVEQKIAEVYATMAEHHVSKSNYTKALEAALEGLTHDASNAQLNYLVGLCYFRKGLDSASRNNLVESRRYFRKASEALEKAIEAEPSHLPALDYLAKSYIKINLPSKAIATWKKIIRLAPESREAKTARDYLRTLGFKNP